MQRHWIAVASAEHVAIGRAQGFMQVCHGKRAPLARLSADDRIAYYSPSRRFGVADGFQSFTAAGAVLAGAPYQYDMGGGFVPFRRDVRWDDAGIASIRPLLDRLGFTRGRRQWGYAFRFGLLEIDADDMATIRSAMGIADDAVDVPVIDADVPVIDVGVPVLDAGASLVHAPVARPREPGHDIAIPRG